MIAEKAVSLSSLDARVLFPLPTGTLLLPWTQIRNTVWWAQRLDDPLAVHRLALAYEEEADYRCLSADSGLSGDDSGSEARRTHRVRQLELMAAVYHARLAELCAEIARAEVREIYKGSEYLQRHPEMLEDFQ